MATAKDIKVGSWWRSKTDPEWRVKIGVKYPRWGPQDASVEIRKNTSGWDARFDRRLCWKIGSLAMLRRSFFKAVGVGLAVLAATYVPGRPWAVEDIAYRRYVYGVDFVTPEPVGLVAWFSTDGTMYLVNDPLRRT